MAAIGPCRSVTKERNRDVFVSRGTLASRGERIDWGGEAAGARRPGATGHSWSTHARNPAGIEAGARARASSHRARPPRTASGVGWSAA
jgi:hypothetical protein